MFFDHASFSQLVDFDGTVFTKAANFSDSHFQEDAGFSESQFQGEANFSRAHFSTEANFSRARFNDADFGRARFDKNFHLSNAKIYTLKLSDAVFTDGSSIYLKDFNFNRIAVRWNTIRDHLPFNGSVYLTLVKNFRNLEQFKDEDDCYYQYRKEKQARTKKLLSKTSRSADVALPAATACARLILFSPALPSSSSSPGSSGRDMLCNWRAQTRVRISQQSTGVSLGRCSLLQQHGVPGPQPAEPERSGGIRVPDRDGNSDGMAADGSVPGHFEQGDAEVECTVQGMYENRLTQDDLVSLSCNLWRWLRA